MQKNRGTRGKIYFSSSFLSSSILFFISSSSASRSFLSSSSISSSSSGAAEGTGAYHGLESHHGHHAHPGTPVAQNLHLQPLPHPPHQGILTTSVFFQTFCNRKLFPIHIWRRVDISGKVITIYLQKVETLLCS